MDEFFLSQQTVNTELAGIFRILEGFWFAPVMVDEAEILCQWLKRCLAFSKDIEDTYAGSENSYLQDKFPHFPLKRCSAPARKNSNV